MFYHYKARKCDCQLFFRENPACAGNSNDTPASDSRFLESLGPVMIHGLYIIVVVQQIQRPLQVLDGVLII